MRNTLASIFLALAVAGCGHSQNGNGTPDMSNGGKGGDMSVKHDMSGANADLKQGNGDGSMKPDDGGNMMNDDGGNMMNGDGGNMMPDASMNADDLSMMMMPDLSMMANDMATNADMSMMMMMNDMAVASDMAMKASDMAVPPDMVTPADMAMGPVKVLTGTYELLGVTTDDLAIVHDTTADSVLAEPLAGGNSILVTNALNGGDVIVDGKVVFVWQNINNNTNAGALHVWSQATGLILASNASIDRLAAATTDGARIVFMGNVNNLGTTGDIIGANTDLTNKTTLEATDQTPAGTVCDPNLGFSGAYAVAGRCKNNNNTPTVSSWTANWTKTDIQVGGASSYWEGDPAGTKVTTLDAKNLLDVSNIDGTGKTQVDVTAVAFALLYGDATGVVYRTTIVNNSNSLRSSPVANPVPLNLLNGTVAQLLALSPDHKYVMFSSVAQDQMTLESDIYLASTTVAGAPATIDAQATATTSYGSDWTTDSTYALYFTAVDGVNFIGTLNARPVGANQPKMISTMVWTDIAAKGTKVVFNDNYNTMNGRADLKSVDVAGNAGATLVHTAADASFFLDAALGRIVFTDNVGMISRGLYVANVP
jgi:hypothetical protein